MSKKQRFGIKETKKFLSELAFSSASGSHKILADVGDQRFFEARAMELHLHMDSLQSEERKRARKQLIQLLVMSAIEEERNEAIKGTGEAGS